MVRKQFFCWIPVPLLTIVVNSGAFSLFLVVLTTHLLATPLVTSQLLAGRVGNESSCQHQVVTCYQVVKTAIVTYLRVN